MVRTTKKKSHDKRKEDVKNNMRRMRQRIKADPEKYEEVKRKERERYHKRKQDGKIKTIAELDDREKRKIRKVWRTRAKKSRESKNKLLTYLDTNTPPASPQQPVLVNMPAEVPSTSRQAEQGKKIARQNRRQMRKEMEKLQNEINLYKRKAEKYKKRFFREKNKNRDPNSPSKIAEDLIKHDPKEAKRKILLGEVITRQVKENCVQKATIQEKHNVIDAISGPLIRKYKFQHVITSISTRLSRNLKKKPCNSKIHRLKNHIKIFLESDDSSRIMPGKKDTITKNKVKKQRRILNDSLQNLHIKFKKDFSQYSKISYSLFCKYRPFWILIPNARSRQTCLCILHENMALVVRKLRYLGIINESFPDQVCKAMCCNQQLGEKCLDRTCELCKERQIEINEFNPEQKIMYMLWRTKKENINVKGVEKTCQKTVKENIESTCGELVLYLKNSILKYMIHLRNIHHQYESIDKIKKHLSENDVLIHMDFSENYNCKYSQEVQSAHFGGSKPQVSLHTVVAYYRNPANTKIDHLNFCTVSKNLRHDPSAILAHLEPIFSEISKIVPKIKKVNFLSDGPSTQYRNKKMFYFINSYIPLRLGCDNISWHYSESGHGKGAPDGIGGAVKRIADAAVAHGLDIASCEDLASLLNNKCTKINIFNIPEETISYYDSLLPLQLKVFPGTMKIHEICWSKQYPEKVDCRLLTCNYCDSNCRHYSLGSVQLPKLDNAQLNEESSPEITSKPGNRLRYSEVYTSDDDSCGSTSSDKTTAEVTINITGQYFKIASGKFILVKFLTKKRTKHYIGLVDYEMGNEYSVKFLRRKTKNKFVYPNEDDIATIPKEDVVLILSSPCERRDQYFFNSDEIKNVVNLE